MHVCRRWRNVVFASPRRLNLQLRWRPVKETLHVWPELPLLICSFSKRVPRRHATNFIAALEEHHRVCDVCIDYSLLKGFAAIDRESVPGDNAPVSSVGYHNRARAGPSRFVLGWIYTSMAFRFRQWRVYSCLPTTSTSLPMAMVTGFSALTSSRPFALNSDTLDVRRIDSPLLSYLTRIVLPALTTFHFKGDGEYLEEIMAQIDTPSLDAFYMTFFNQLIFDTPRLRDIIARTKMFKAPPVKQIYGFLMAKSKSAFFDRMARGWTVTTHYRRRSHAYH